MSLRPSGARMATRLARLCPQRMRSARPQAAPALAPTSHAESAAEKGIEPPHVLVWSWYGARVAETVWRPHGDSARTSVPTAHAKCPSSAPALARTSHAEWAAEKGIEPPHVVVWSWYRLGLVVCLTNGL